MKKLTHDPPPPAYVKKHWKKKTVPMMARDSGFTNTQIIYACSTLGITPVTERDLKTAIVLDNYEKYSAMEIAEKFDISRPTIRDICKEYGINCLTPEQSKERKRKTEQPKKSFWDKIKENGGYDFGINQTRYGL